MKWTPAKIACGMFLLALLSLVGVSTPVFATDYSVTLSSSYQTICDNSDQNNPNCADYTIFRFYNPDKVYSQYSLQFYIMQNDVCSSTASLTATTSPGSSMSANFESLDYNNYSDVCRIDARARNVPAGSDITAILTNKEEQEPCPECQECQVCPAIPENPYDDKLDAIKVAIYVVAGTILVIYFFYCIYRMIIKGGKL